MGRATTYGIWSVFLYLVVTWLTVQGYIHLRMNMIPYPCTEQREGGGPWIGRESQVLFIFVNKWVMYFWWSSIRGGGGGGGWTSQSIGPDDSGYYYVIKRKVCSSLNGQLLTDNCQCKKSADQHNIKNCGLSCAACMYACKRFDAWHSFDSIDRCQRKKSTDQENIKYCNLTCKTHQGQMSFLESWQLTS